MFDPDALPSPDRRHFYRRAGLAPLCLLLVAGLHLARVWTANQTPWKGGGFGMFSTVDGERARFLRCYLVADAARLPLPIPPGLNKTLAELRAAPSPAGCEALARRLANHAWRWRDDRQRRETAATVTAGPLIGGEHVLEPIGLDEPATGAVLYSAVIVECWRYRYDAASATLRAERIASASVSPEVRP